MTAATVKLSVPKGSIVMVHGDVVFAQLRGTMLEAHVKPGCGTLTRLDHSFNPVISRFYGSEITQIPVEVV